MSETTESDVELVRRAIEDGYDERDPEVARDVFAAELDLMEAERSISVEELIANMEAFHEAMPDISHTIHDVWQDGDTVIVHYSNAGTFENELQMEVGPMAGLSVEPNGEEISYSGTYICRVADGDIVGWANYVEELSVYQQMGVLPDLEEAVE